MSAYIKTLFLGWLLGLSSCKLQPKNSKLEKPPINQKVQNPSIKTPEVIKLPGLAGLPTYHTADNRPTNMTQPAAPLPPTSTPAPAPAPAPDPAIHLPSNSTRYQSYLHDLDRLDWPKPQHPSSTADNITPKTKKVSVLSDFYDDMLALITPLGQSVTKETVGQNLEQWFQTWKNLGISRILVFHSPLSILADYDTYYCPENKFTASAQTTLCRDWLQHKAQLTALYESPVIKAVNYGNALDVHSMQRKIMWHLNPEFGALFREAAKKAGIKVGTSYHAFEHTISKYFDIPTFGTTGDLKWFFSPFGRPEFLYHPQQSGLAHYREILEKRGQSKEGLVSSIEIFPVPHSSLSDAESLFIPKAQHQTETSYAVYASMIPPIADNALVLQQTGDQGYRVVAFKDIAADVQRHMKKLPPKQVIWNQQTGTLRLEGLPIDTSTSFLLIKGPKLCPDNPLTFKAPHGLEDVRFYNQANRELDRITYFWSFDDDTRVSYLRPPPHDGNLPSLFLADYRSHFKLQQEPYTQSGLALCGDQVLVIYLGTPYSTEMLDFEQSEVRNNEVKHLKYLTDLTGSESVLINSRSHVDSFGPQNGQYSHIAYAPRSLATVPESKALPAAEMIKWYGIEEYGSFDPRHSCQSVDCPIPYRYQRNLAVARGLQMLIRDLQDLQVEVLLPETYIATAKLNRYKAENGLGQSEFFSSNNYNPWFVDGLGLVDLKGLTVKPSYMGLRDSLPARPHLNYFLDTITRDLQDNRGAFHQGYRSILWESGYLTGDEKKSGICALLSAPDIDEVILYATFLHYNLGSTSFLTSPDCK